jgi:hypothetical protein
MGDLLGAEGNLIDGGAPMAKPKKHKPTEQRTMNTACGDSITPDILQLTESQKNFEAQLTAARLIEEAIAKLDEATHSARVERITGFVKAATASAPAPTPAAITDLAKTASRELKTAEDKAKESKDALQALGTHLEQLIALFEEQHCTDALAVYCQELAAFRQSDAQKLEIEKKIEQLQRCCREQPAAAK